VELLLHPRGRRVASLLAFTKLAAIAVVGSFATLIVVTILGSVGIGFAASGVVVFALGVLETSGIHLPGVQLSGVPPEWVVVLGLPVLAIGVGALVLLRSYLRFVGRAIKKTLLRREVAAA
jgi:hypothetical protein